MNLDIRHDPDLRKFFCVVNGLESLLEYDWSGDGRMTFFHTYVPGELRGLGIGQALAESAADYALRNGLRVSASCSFAAAVMKSNPKYKSILAGD